MRAALLGGIKPDSGAKICESAPPPPTAGKVRHRIRVVEGAEWKGSGEVFA